MFTLEQIPDLYMFFSEYSWHIHFWPRRGGGGGPGWLLKKNLPLVISEILGLLMTTPTMKMSAHKWKWLLTKTDHHHPPQLMNNRQDKVLSVPPLFLLDSSQSCGFWWNSGRIYQLKCHSCHGIVSFWYVHQNGPWTLVTGMEPKNAKYDDGVLLTWSVHTS